MITNKELNEINLSPTKKDYYQIWNELLELADKISERWSPASTNESDPGIVLLKALTAIADKLNYNIDKNTLEAFMPSATQEESMRKLTEMMGYNMKYYQSATCKINISYKESNTKSINQFGNGILIPKFTNIKNQDEDINYLTLKDIVLYENAASRDVDAIEGELIECESANDNIISMLHLDDLNRYILPETGIAENGIFITNIYDTAESQDWKKEENLNTLLPGTKAYKFGFDSRQQLPYVQFTDDISSLIEDGLRIRYIRTNGFNGNVKATTLTKLEKPAIWSTSDDENITSLSVDDFEVTNASAATNGANPESLNSAYNNYKKTIGTFETLVTCRDYMNRIYQMTESTTDTTPLVSNVIVSDIRDDINRSTPLCSFNDYGICYTNVALKDADGNNKIDHFDLLLYPFKTITGLNSKKEYDNSFKYSAKNKYKIEADLQNNKTISHNIISPDSNDISCIKNYLRIKAKIATTRKVTYLEEADILDKVYKSIYTNFNSRKLDFGEEIPYEAIVETIKNADYRIKDVSVDDPALYTKFCKCDENGTELELVAQTDSNIESQKEANRIYNNLVLRNILAGKIAAFHYDTNFNSSFNKTKYDNFGPIYNNINTLVSKFDLQTAWSAKDTNKEGLELKENQVIQFRLPNLKTTKTYPAYVNYFLKRNTSNVGTMGIPATFMTLADYMNESNRWESFVNTNNIKDRVKAVDVTLLTKYGLTSEATDKDTKFKGILDDYVVLFTKASDNTYVKNTSNTYDTATTYYYLEINDNIFAAFNTWIKAQTYVCNADGDTDTLTGIYKSVGVKNTVAGKLVDMDLIQYMSTYKFGSHGSNYRCLTNAYVQRTYTYNSPEVTANLATIDGLGQSADYATISKDSEYQLKDGEYLLINYTDSKTDESTGTESKSVINEYYGPGKIIRPNFGIVDSALYHNNHSYSKRDGFSFTKYSITDPEGMFTLGANEQIEIREIVNVELDKAGSCLYWILNSDTPHKLEFTEKYNSPTNNAYTLKEGEYLLYTTSQKQNLAYYGSGSVIIKSSDTPVLELDSDDEVSIEDIMTNGLAADIPWKSVDLRGNAKLTIIENQYVSLTAGDTIMSITTDTSTTGGIVPLDNDWETITGASYKFTEDSSITTLPSVNISGINWTARTRLDFNMSKTTDQILNVGDSITVTYKNSSGSNTSEILQVNANKEPLHINSSHVCQAALDTIKISSEIDNFKLKISKESPAIASDNNIISLNNYINGSSYYTKFSFSSTKTSFNLNTLIPESTFGLLMLYYTEPTTTTVSITAYKETAQESGVRIFNSGNDYSSSITLSAGINILELAPGVDKLTIAAANDATIIFGNIDIVTGINKKLDYRIIDATSITEANKLAQLLTDIKTTGVANNFYYNIPIQDSNSIDLNNFVEEDTLSYPYSWYDTNNVNNKFVISEIDSSYLSSGITLTKTSRA